MADESNALEQEDYSFVRDCLSRRSDLYPPIEEFGAEFGVECVLTLLLVGFLEYVNWWGADSAPRQISRINGPISMGQTAFDSSHSELSESL